jgi:hypothetical protein
VNFRQTTKKRTAPDPNAPCAENTTGVLMEHFDLSTPYEDGEEVIIYGRLYETAKETAASAGWAFRSYSSHETPGCDADYIKRNIRQFPTLILFRDGVELGRHTAIINTVAGILFWAKTLLGIECEEPARPPISACLRDSCHITPSGLVLRKEGSQPTENTPQGP